MRLEQFVIGMLLIGFLITGSFFFVNDMGQGYDKQADDSEFDSLLEDTEDAAKEINASWAYLRKETSANLLAQFFTGVAAMFSIAKQVLVTPVSTSITVITQFMTTLGLPAWVGLFASSIIMALLVFAFIALIFRFKG
jgi:hypothetical protein